jgi:hypothetical protein
MRQSEQSVEVTDIAIKRQLEAVRLTSLDSPDLPTYLNNLGLSFIHGFERFEEKDDIGDAIERQLEAVRLTPLNLNSPVTVCIYHLLRRLPGILKLVDNNDGIK